MENTEKDALLLGFDKFVDYLDRNCLSAKEEYHKFRPLLAADQLDYQKIDLELDQLARPKNAGPQTTTTKTLVPTTNNPGLQSSISQHNIDSPHDGRPYTSRREASPRDNRDQAIDTRISDLWQMTETSDDVIYKIMPSDASLGPHIDMLAKRNRDRVYLDNIKIRNGLLIEF